jgi:hypothetical protein
MPHEPCMLNHWETDVEDGVRVIQRLDFFRTVISFGGLNETLARGLRLRLRWVGKCGRTVAPAGVLVITSDQRVCVLCSSGVRNRTSEHIEMSHC